MPPKMVTHSHIVFLREPDPCNISLLRGVTPSMGKIDCGQKRLNSLVILDSSTNTKGQRQLTMCVIEIH